jgi:hypothetical protein
VLLTLDSALTPSTGYTVTVNGVVDLNGDSTANASVNFVATTAPTVVSAQPDTFGSGNVVVTFDRPLDQTTAETFLNYNLVPGSPTVTGATLLGPASKPGFTGYRVRLSTSGSLIPNVPYSVSVQNVQSASPCSVAVVAGSTTPLFTNTPCGTNGCITFIGGTNKTVPCGSSWTFDPPTNIVDNCCSNYVVNFNSITNSTNCTSIVTGYWTITDTCSNFATWTQTVTIPSPATIICHPDKTIPCTANVIFNAPTIVSNACCTNYQILTVGSDVTNNLGTCSYSITRTWLVTACCATNFCTQKITITNAAPIITCFPNKAIPCTSALVFNTPLANSACCGTNTHVFTLGNDVTNNLGPCSYSVTRQWLILDCCGHTNFCSQMITVTSAPPVIVCATNKFIPCTSNVVFDPPSVVSSCCGTNYSVSIFGSDVTTPLGGCAYATTRTWMVTDCCGNTNFCSQTITVSPPSSYTLTLPVGTSLIANQLDHGANTADILFPNPFGQRDGDVLYIHYNTNCVNGSLAGYVFDSAGSPTGFDDSTTYAPVAAPVLAPGEGAFYENEQGVPETVTFTGTVHCPVQPPSFNCPCGTFYLLSYQIDCPGTYEDVTGLLPQEGAEVLRWNGSGYDIYTYSGGTWSPSEPVLKVGEAAYYSFPCPTNPCSISMTCSTNKTVPCGTSWDFDAPTNIVDNCCSNFTVTFNTVTNSGPCPLVITRTWIISDTCGHSTNCSQTVTVVSAGPAFTGLPIGGYLGCNPLILPTDSSIMAQVSTTTGCGFVTNVTHVDGGTPCAPTRVFTITVSNLCGIVSTNVGYSWNADTTPAVIVSAPHDANLGCNPAFLPTDASVKSLVVATDNCGIAIVNVSHHDSGTPCAMTRTFLITATDACGTPPNNTWVTVYSWKVDNTPPVINCSTKSYTVALDTNCQLVIPKIPVSATDNCGGTLTPHQNPAAGTVVSAHSATVDVWVTDSCNNTSAHCHVTVIGLDKTGPVLSGPTNIVVTNCLVPCVTNLVNAHDNCCPPWSLKKTQSPPCGTLLGPGINSVTVTVTDCNGNSSIWIIHLSTSGQQSFLANLYNTGVNNSHSPLSFGATDPHWTLNAGCFPGSALAVKGPWTLAPASGINSDWIAPCINPFTHNCPAVPSGYYLYTYHFNIPGNLDPTTASISGRWAAGKWGYCSVNGNSYGPPLGTSIPSGVDGAKKWTPFTITGLQAANTMQFFIFNPSGPNGLRVEFTNAIANCYTCAPPVIVRGGSIGSVSVPRNGVASLNIFVQGTPPLTYQWYYNGTPLANNSHYSGVDTGNLVIKPANYGDAGLYTLVVSNPCGTATGKVSLSVTPGRPWDWAWWNVAQLDNPLAASFGPDLSLVGSDDGTNFSITAGTTDDFGLPNAGGQLANVMHVAPLPSDTSLQVPLIAPAGSNSVSSYTIIMDLYQPLASLGTPSTLFRNSGWIPTNGLDGVELTLDASNYLHIDGIAGGVPFDQASATPMPVETWTRVALIIDDPQDGPYATVSMYEDGQDVGDISVPAVSGLGINWSNSSPTMLSRQTNDLNVNGEFYMSGAQFHAVALDSLTIAGMGSLDDVPTPSDDTSVDTQPALSMTFSNGVVVMSWTGSPYVLQETSDLASDDWTDSAIAFTENQVGPDTVTTAIADPRVEGPSKFYRLVFRP